MHWQRQFLHPMMKAFDAPRREECTAQRPRSNTPLASLTLLNDPTFVEAARAFAERILRTSKSGTTDSELLDTAFMLAVSRTPDAFERSVLRKLLSASRKQYQGNEKAARDFISAGIAPTPYGIEVTEHAAWTVVARTLLGLGETTTRN